MAKFESSRSLGAPQVSEQEDSESLPDCCINLGLVSETGVMADDQAVASPAAPLEAAPLDALGAAQPILILGP